MATQDDQRYMSGRACSTARVFVLLAAILCGPQLHAQVPEGRLAVTVENTEGGVVAGANKSWWKFRMVVKPH
jgi:hypothetical protein